MLIYGGGGAWVFEGSLVFPWWFCLVISFVCMVVLGCWRGGPRGYGLRVMVGFAYRARLFSGVEGGNGQWSRKVVKALIR